MLCRVACAFNNVPLSRLAASELEALMPYLARVEFRKGETVGSERDADSLYFVESGLVCVVASLGTKENLALAITGNEGVGGALTILGPPISLNRFVAPVAGSAFRTDAALLREHPRAFRRTRDVVQRYSQVVLAQFVESAICNRYHTGRERLASWLLLAADLCGTTNLAITHEVLAQMVGGPRSLVTTALLGLRQANAIDYRRGIVSIDHEALIHHSCECYGRVTSAIQWFTS